MEHEGGFRIKSQTPRGLVDSFIRCWHSIVFLAVFFFGSRVSRRTNQSPSVNSFGPQTYIMYVTFKYDT